VIPHITDEIKRCILTNTENYDIVLVEIGGTVGDIESLPFLEAIRQLRIELGATRTAFIHLTLVPYIPSAGEVKTKPTQHSVKELRSIGIQPDVLICRCQHVFKDVDRKKIALFTNVEERAVIVSPDMQSIYQIPRVLHEQHLDDIILEKFNLRAAPANLTEWDEVVRKQSHPKTEVTIALVGKYVNLTDAYKSLNEALTHAAIQTEIRVNLRYIDSEGIEEQGVEVFQGIDAILVPGGFGMRGIEGKIKAAQFAREHGIPYLGICLGMQIAVIEFARNLAGMKEANSTEFNLNTAYPVIALVTEWLDEKGQQESRDQKSNLGGSMRLGAQGCRLSAGSLAESIYQKAVIEERHRHRYEVNNALLPAIEKQGLRVSGRSLDGRLVEMIEIPTHPWFVGCQFHPEFTSTPREGHPLFISFVKAAIKQSEGKVNV
jgi:CTP synthase